MKICFNEKKCCFEKYKPMKKNSITYLFGYVIEFFKTVRYFILLRRKCI